MSLALCAARLAELFPALFAPPVKPLKLRIQADLQERAPGVFTRKVLSVFLHRHTTSTAYLKALVHLGQRFDLDGAPCGDITAEHRDAAVAEMARRRGVFDARREAERQAQRDAEKAQRDAHLAQERQRREAHAAQDQQRRDRLGLLRAWETSTLTRANFCALKGIAQADLDAQLALARDDAAQRAAMPQPAWAPADQPRPYDGPREARDTRDTRGNIRPQQARPGAPRQSPDQRGARPPRSSRPPRSGGGGNEPSA